MTNGPRSPHPRTPHRGTPETRPLAGYRYLDPTIPLALRTPFDVDSYVRRAPGPHTLDTSSLADQGPLSAADRQVLQMLHRWEASALAESRTMLAGPTGREPRITAFLATWHVERLWQARALRDLLMSRPAPVLPPQHTPRTVRRKLRRIQVDHITPALSSLGTVLIGEPIVAGHMARLAIQESALEAAVRILGERTHGETRRVLTHVADRHVDAVDFFSQEARARIRRSRREAVTARVVLSLQSPFAVGGILDPVLPGALRTLASGPRERARLRRGRDEVLGLLPGPRLRDPVLGSLLDVSPSPGATHRASPAPHSTIGGPLGL